MSTFALSFSAPRLYSKMHPAELLVQRPRPVERPRLTGFLDLLRVIPCFRTSAIDSRILTVGPSERFLETVCQLNVRLQRSFVSRGSRLVLAHRSGASALAGTCCVPADCDRSALLQSAGTNAGGAGGCGGRATEVATLDGAGRVARRCGLRRRNGVSGHRGNLMARTTV